VKRNLKVKLVVSATILALFAAALMSTVALASSSTFGQTVKGGSGAWQGSGVMIASRFTSSTSGLANSISVYISNSGGSSVPVKCAIYKETDKTLLAATQENTVSAGYAGWQTFSFTSQPTITSGASYSIVAWFGAANCYVYYSSGSSAQSWYSTQTYSTYPNGPYSSFSGYYGQENVVYSIYATISTTSSSSSSTPSPTATPSPTPAPTSTPNANNLASIPNGWYLTYDSASNTPQIISLDYSVERTSGQPSIRLDPHTNNDVNVAREVDGKWYNVHPGDHIVATVWMKVQTGPSTPGYPFCGARMAIDFYGSVNGNQELLSADSFWNNYYGTGWNSAFTMYVQDSNGGAWQQKTIDIIVPATASDSNGKVGSVNQIVLWLQGNPWTATSAASTVWFADPTLYINP